MLATAVVVTLFPFYAMVVIALKPPGAVVIPDSLVPWPLELEALTRLLRNPDILRWAVNTVVYSAVSVVLVLLIASMAGYAFAKKRFAGGTLAFWTIVAMIMVPYHMTLIPLFILVSRADGVNTYWGLIVPTLANVQAIFLMRQFIRALPDELIEAARMDGCSEFGIFWRIVLPLCKPILATLGIFVFLWHWNDFLWPLVVGQDPAMRTLTTGVASMQRSETPLNELLAGAFVSFAPIFVAYLFAQRFFRQGVVMSGIKG